MAHTIINPDGLHDPTGLGYSHVARTSGDLVFIAGQYASDGDGRVTSPDFAEQVDRSLDNLHTALTPPDSTTATSSSSALTSSSTMLRSWRYWPIGSPGSGVRARQRRP